MRIANNAPSTNKKLMPFNRKHHAGPFHASANPATAGPATRAPLKIDEFNAIALGKSSRTTICTRNDCRIGTSKAFTMPTKKATRISSHTLIASANVSAANANASTIDTACVAITP